MEDENPSVANPGLIRPPIVYIAAILLGFMMGRFWQMQFPFDDASKPAAGLFFLIGLVLLHSTQREFRRANTPIPGNRPTRALVVSGPFRLSRNPMYLAFALIHLAVAFWIQSVWIVITLVIATLVISKIMIPREERYMKARFGCDYITYQSTTGRWF